MYINTTTLTKHTESEIRAAFPNVSFPQPFVPPDEYAVVFPTPQPAYNLVTQSVCETTPELTALGHWEQRWEVVELFETQEERDTAIVADAEAKRLAAIAGIVADMESLFDTIAQSKRYDNRVTCALRAGYAGPFQAEGLAFATWMDTCNATAYQMLAEVQAGTRQMPATSAEALALLPEMVWP